MALSWSTGVRDFVAMHGSYKRAFQGGTLEIRSGSAPATADTAVSGTLLTTVHLSGGDIGKEVLAKGTVTLSGASGTVTSIVVGAHEILGATITFTSTLAATALLVAAQINRYQPIMGEKYMAVAAGASIQISALYGTGTAGNGTDVTTTCAGGDLSAVDVNMGGTAGTGVDGSNGLTFGDVATGVLSKTGTWVGTNGVTGVAGYFRLLGSINDAGTASTTLNRVQGVCGIASGDYPMTTTTLTATQTHTVDTFTLTLPAA